MSIQPKWCELIASGKKTVEVRKNKPKLATPFKVYIYQTLHRENNGRTYSDGKVIGEFVCDKIYAIRYSCGSYRCEGLTRHENDRVASASQLSLYDMRNYLSCNGGYGWNITDLVIYEKPKQLSEFYVYCGDNPKCDGCEAHYFSNTECGKEDYCCSIIDGCRPLKRPPQSWCYAVKGE